MPRAVVEPPHLRVVESAKLAAPLADGVFVVQAEDGSLRYFWQDTRTDTRKRLPPVRLPDDQTDIAFTRALLAARREAGVPEYPGHKPRNGIGYVYFLAAGKFVKIGFSKSPYERLKDLATGRGDRLSSFVVIPGSFALEGELHKLFSADRANGEWFHRTAKLEKLMASAARGKLGL